MHPLVPDTVLETGDTETTVDLSPLLGGGVDGHGSPVHMFVNETDPHSLCPLGEPVLVVALPFLPVGWVLLS